MVKNIAYATEEETLMGNGVNLRTLTNDGGSAVISDYGAHLLRWAPGGAAGCNLDAPHMAFRSWSAGWRGSAGVLPLVRAGVCAWRADCEATDSWVRTIAPVGAGRRGVYRCPCAVCAGFRTTDDWRSAMDRG